MSDMNYKIIFKDGSEMDFSNPISVFVFGKKLESSTNDENLFIPYDGKSFCFKFEDKSINLNGSEIRAIIESAI